MHVILACDWSARVLTDVHPVPVGYHRLMKGERLRTAVVGAGYVGLATAVGLAEHGRDAVLVERDPHRLAALEAGLAEDLGVDVGPVLEGIGHDPRIERTYMRPSYGFGGSCLPKEVRTKCATAPSDGRPSPRSSIEPGTASWRQR